MISAPHEKIVLAAILLAVAGAVGCGRATTELPSSALSGSMVAGSVVAGSVAADSAAAGSVAADSAAAGSVAADSAAGSAVDGSVVAGSGLLLVADGSGKDGRSAPLDSKSLRYTVRKTVAPNRQTNIPPVLLSAGHAKLSRVQVGESFPQLQLPRLGGAKTDLSTLRGQRATVVLFWNADRWMARTALTDLQRDIANQFDASQVSVVGIAVRQPAGAVQAALNRAGATFPQFLDSDGRSFATLGSVALPRIYVLDRAGRIVWFDIEYSEGTRRELWQTLYVLTK